MTDEEYAEAKWLWSHGSTIEAIAQMVGYSEGMIKHVSRNNRRDFPARKSRLTDDERERIRELRLHGMTYREVAHEVGRSLCAVQNALKEEK